MIEKTESDVQGLHNYIVQYIITIQWHGIFLTVLIGIIDVLLKVESFDLRHLNLIDAYSYLYCSLFKIMSYRNPQFRQY